MMSLVGATQDNYLEYSKMKEMVAKFLLKDHIQQTPSLNNLNEDAFEENIKCKNNPNNTQ